MSQPGAVAIRFPPIKDGVPTTAVLVPRFAALQDTLEQILEQIEANPRAFATRLTTQDLLEEVERSMLASSASESKLTQEEIIGLATRTTLVTRQLSIDDSMRIVILYHARMFVISSHITNARLVLQFYPAFARDALSRFGTPSSPTDTVVAASNSAVDQLTAFVYNTITPYLGQPRPRKSKNITIPLTIVQSLVQLPVASVEKILLALRNNTLVPSLSFTFYEKLTSSSFDDYFLYVITDLLTKALSIPTCRALERYTDRLEEGFVGKEAEALSFDGLVEDEEAASETKRRITQRYDIIKGLTGSDGQHIDLSIFALPELLSFLHRPLQYYKQSMAYSPALLLLANNCRRGGHLSLSDGMLAVLGKQMRAVGKSIKLIAAVEKVEEVLTKVRSALGSKKGGKGAFHLLILGGVSFG